MSLECNFPCGLKGLNLWKIQEEAARRYILNLYTQTLNRQLTVNLYATKTLPGLLICLVLKLPNLWGKYVLLELLCSPMQFQQFYSVYHLTLAALFLCAVLLAGCSSQSMSWETCQVTRVCYLFDINDELSLRGVWHCQFFVVTCYLKCPVSVLPLSVMVKC